MGRKPLNGRGAKNLDHIRKIIAGRAIVSTNTPKQEPSKKFKFEESRDRTPSGRHEYE